MCLLAKERQVSSSLVSSVISALELPPSAPGAGNLSAASDARAECACLCQTMGRPCVMPTFANSGWLM